MTLSRAYRYCPCASSFKGWLATITTMPCIHKGFVPAAHFCRRVLSQIPLFMTPLRHQSYFLEFTLMIRTGRNRTCILRICRVAFPIKLPFLFCFLKDLQCPIKNRTWGSFDVHLIDNKSIIFKTHKNVEICFTCRTYKTINELQRASRSFPASPVFDSHIKSMLFCHGTQRLVVQSHFLFCFLSWFDH